MDDEGAAAEDNEIRGGRGWVSIIERSWVVLVAVSSSLLVILFSSHLSPTLAK